MKRTRDNPFVQNPNWQYRENISSIQDFEGEDLRKEYNIEYDSRK